MLHEIQKAYIEAKALYEATNEEFAERTRPFDYLLEAGQIDEYVDAEMEIREEMEMNKVWDLMKEAKNALMTWGYEVIKSRPEYEDNKADLDKVFQTAMKRTYPNITEKVVKLCVELDASTI